MLGLLQHLLPRALAWRLVIDRTLRRLLEGLAVLPADVRAFVDLAYLDLFPQTTRELAAWQNQFGLSPGGGEEARRGKLQNAWSTQGRQSPDYIQRALHAAGFTTVFIHEWWWLNGPPWAARDPRDFTTAPLIGEYQCEGSDPWLCFDSAPGDPLAPHCDNTLVNDPGYVVNLDLTRRPPPPVPDDPSYWPYFLYFGGEVFGEYAPVDASRVAELKELILRIAPSQQWIVLMIDAVDDFGDGFGSGDFGTMPMGA